MNYNASLRLQRLSSHVVYGRNWFDGSVYHPSGSDNPKGCIGWVGRLEEAKDPALAVATFRELKELGRPFRAWIAGSGSLIDEIREQVERDGLTEEVELLGELAADELAGRLSESSVLLITSHSEGLPRAALEALGCGTPIVSTRCGDLTRLISDQNGRLVASREPRELADAVWKVEDSVSRSQTASSVDEYEMRIVLDGLFRQLELTPAPALAAQSRRSRLVVVSYLADDPLQPRGARTKALLNQLDHHSVEVMAGPARGTRNGRLGSSRARRLAGRALGAFLIDKFELTSRRRFLNWQPQADGALLIGYPFSPVLHAATRLSRLRVPYVVDVGDPIALTARRPTMRGLSLHRARRAEARMWANAAGAVVTTPSQRDSLRALYPHLPILARPNGVETNGIGAVPRKDARAARPDTLALAHFGSVYKSRLEIGPFVRRLVRDGPWRRVEITQFGPDWTRELEGLGPGVDIQIRDPLPWPEAMRRSSEFDAALVIGNVDPGQLPSKVVSYLTLPIPRIALTLDPEQDAIGTYLRDKSGWLVLRPDSPDAAELIRLHVVRDWSPAELAPPASESWDVVGKEVADFVLEALGRPSDRSKARAPAARAYNSARWHAPLRVPRPGAATKRN
jgi:glycosyltransferase involved in cell wall biosynthesis